MVYKYCRNQYIKFHMEPLRIHIVLVFDTNIEYIYESDKCRKKS